VGAPAWADSLLVHLNVSDPWLGAQVGAIVAHPVAAQPPDLRHLAFMTAGPPAMPGGGSGRAAAGLAAARAGLPAPALILFAAVILAALSAGLWAVRGRVGSWLPGWTEWRRGHRHGTRARAVAAVMVPLVALTAGVLGVHQLSQPTPAALTGSHQRVTVPAGTIAMLLGQTAGTGDYLDDPGYLRVRDSFESVSDLIGAVNTGVPPGVVPGKIFAFSTTGYLLLGAVIEKASGRDYYDYMDNEVFAKAGVASGFLHNTEEERNDRGFALGYKPDESQNWSGLPVRGTPATGAYATAPDLLSFHKALSTGALVKPETLKRLVLVPQTPGLTSGTFSGDDVGASAVFAMTPNGYTVIVLANVSGAAGPVADRILKLLASGS